MSAAFDGDSDILPPSRLTVLSAAVDEDPDPLPLPWSTMCNDRQYTSTSSLDRSRIIICRLQCCKHHQYTSQPVVVVWCIRRLRCSCCCFTASGVCHDSLQHGAVFFSLPMTFLAAANEYDDHRCCLKPQFSLNSTSACHRRHSSLIRYPCSGTAPLPLMPFFVRRRRSAPLLLLSLFDFCNL